MSTLLVPDGLKTVAVTVVSGGNAAKKDATEPWATLEELARFYGLRVDRVYRIIARYVNPAYYVGDLVRLENFLSALEKDRTAATWHVTVHEKWHTLISGRLKTYEGRRNTPKTQQYKIGDELWFHVHEKHVVKDELSTKCSACVPVRTVIVDIRVFNSFKEALSVLPLKDVLPTVDTVEAGVTIYSQYVNLETQEKEGVRLFGLRID